MFIEPGAPPVSFVYSDSDMDYDETWKQINTASFPVDEHLGILWLTINLEYELHLSVLHIVSCTRYTT